METKPKNLKLTGFAVSSGIAVGNAVWWRKTATKAVTDSSPYCLNTDKQLTRLESAIEGAKQQIIKSREVTRERMGPTQAAIFDAHLLILEDASYIGEMKRRMINEMITAEHACEIVTNDVCNMLQQLTDEHIRARSSDVQDVSSLLMASLSPGEVFHRERVRPGVVIVAEELTPSDVAHFPSEVAGIVVERGNSTGHAMIMARALKIPVVINVEGVHEILDESTLVLDGNRGIITLNPDQRVLEHAQVELNECQARWTTDIEKARGEAVTKDGKCIHVMANVGSILTIADAMDNGADGIGLLRSEFIYFERNDWPSEDEQYEIYKQVLHAVENRQVTIRTLDIGGDKRLPYVKIAHEDNPFLGDRGIRFCLNRLEIFQTQLRALLRASIFGNLRIMLPMITDVAEVRTVKGLILECKRELKIAGHQVKWPIPLGIMVETPSAALISDRLAKEVDFISIGTNDLTQYTLAADRGNDKVTHIYDPYHPAVLELVSRTCEAARMNNIPVGVCGEMAGDEQITALLLSFGVDELSMNSVSIPVVKRTIRDTDILGLSSLSKDALCQESAHSVRQLLEIERVGLTELSL